MRFSRWRHLMECSDEDAQLTQDELDAGWHWCPEWDYLLINPQSPEFESCRCGILVTAGSLQLPCHHVSPRWLPTHRVVAATRCNSTTAPDQRQGEICEVVAYDHSRDQVWLLFEDGCKQWYYEWEVSAMD